MKKFLSKRIVIAACLLLAALFLVRVPASRLRSRVVTSISTALGRSVEVGSLQMRFLPRPGFHLQDLVIHDDTAFGAEPLLRAPEVIASLQVSALLRGRIEVATLSFSDASINLSRNPVGEWNFTDLLQRTSTSTVAPTASHAHSRQFPYIEGTDARINFKTGIEKTRFALTDVKFALWQDSENTWGARLRARPIRTDSNLTDTGILNVSGMWQRSAVLREIPVNFSFDWRQAQIGQVSSLIYGNDKGWRGNAAFSGVVRGTPEYLNVTLDSSVDDFRRREIFGGNDLRLLAHCAADVNVFVKSLTNIVCVSPSGVGGLQLTGDVLGDNASAFWPSDYSLRLAATNVPAESILSLVRHIRPEFANNIMAEGMATGSASLRRLPAKAVDVEASGAFQNLTLRSAVSPGEVALGTVPFSLVTQHSQAGADTRQRKKARNAGISKSNGDSQQSAIEVGPVKIATGKGSSVRLEAQLAKGGYRASLQGTAGVKRLLQSAPVLGIPAPVLNADGNSTVDLTMVGRWSGDRPNVLGTAHLRSVFAQLRGTNAPLQISKADVVLNDDSVRVQNLTAIAADATWHGSLRFPRPCASPRDCNFDFDLHSAEINAGSLNKFFNPSLRKQSWYKLLSLNTDTSAYLLQARAKGRITVDKLLLGSTSCSHLATDLRLNEGHVTFSALRAKVLEGQISGDWDANFISKPPFYRGAGKIEGVSLDDVSELMRNQWINGTANATYEFSSSGWTIGDLLASADLNVDFSMSDGSFRRIVLEPKSSPLQVQEFSGTAKLHDGTLVFNDTKLDTGDGIYSVSGEASLSGALNFKFSATGATGFFISGDIQDTRVTTNPTTAASLKP